MDTPNSTPPSKRCIKCDEVKPLAEFSRHVRAKDGHRADCKTCAAAHYLAYREQNREREAERQRAWYEANREYVAERKRAYRQVNKEHIAEYRRAYYEANPDKRRAADLRRRRLLAEAVQEPYSRLEIFERDGWVCQLCQEPVDPQLVAPDPRSASVDHVVPLSLGGDDIPTNVQTAHFGCNSAKCNRAEGVAS